MASGAVLFGRSRDLAKIFSLLYGFMAFGAQEVRRAFHSILDFPSRSYIVLVIRVFEFRNVSEIRPLWRADLVAVAAVVHIWEIRKRACLRSHAVTLETGRMAFFDRQLAPPCGNGIYQLVAIRAFRRFARSDRYVRDAGGFVGYALDLKVRG